MVGSGGNATWREAVWQRLGNVPNYIEPFFGSGAMLLGRPQPFDGVETINDKDGLVANFWRAVQAAPDEVAKWADWPVNENDLHARHHWLVERKDSIGPKLEGDPEWFDAKGLRVLVLGDLLLDRGQVVFRRRPVAGARDAWTASASLSIWAMPGGV